MIPVEVSYSQSLYPSPCGRSQEERERMHRAKGRRDQQTAARLRLQAYCPYLNPKQVKHWPKPFMETHNDVVFSVAWFMPRPAWAKLGASRFFVCFWEAWWYSFQHPGEPANPNEPWSNSFWGGVCRGVL